MLAFGVWDLGFRVVTGIGCLVENTWMKNKSEKISEQTLTPKTFLGKVEKSSRQKHSECFSEIPNARSRVGKTESSWYLQIIYSIILIFLFF